MDGRFDGFEIMFREVEVIFVRIKKRIFYMNKGRQPNGRIVVSVRTDDKQVSDKTLIKPLGQ